MKAGYLVAIMLLSMAVMAVGCTDPDKAKSALDQAGYTGVEITGYRWWGCGKDDVFHTGFRATGPGGKPASGCVCSGWFKGATIRLD